MVAHAGSTFAMVGYGPITSTYCILATNEHTRSLADVAQNSPDSLSQILKLRTKLENARGPLLMTEHGRVPVCRDDGDEHDPHCFHGHALLFSAENSIESALETFYRHRVSFNDIFAAAAYAVNLEQYFLVSPKPNRYTILSGPLNAPRQLARTLVAINSNMAQLSDWRSDPRKPEAVARAEALRSELTRVT
jgi:hypothetical protein